jgi:hypothetical protein
MKQIDNEIESMKSLSNVLATTPKIFSREKYEIAETFFLVVRAGSRLAAKEFDYSIS